MSRRIDLSTTQARMKNAIKTSTFSSEFKVFIYLYFINFVLQIMIPKFYHNFLFLFSVTHFDLSNKTLQILAPCEQDPTTSSYYM